MSHPLHCLFTTKLGTESIVSAIIWYVASHQGIVVWNDRSKLISLHTSHLGSVFVLIMVKIPIHSLNTDFLLQVVCLACLKRMWSESRGVGDVSLQGPCFLVVDDVACEKKSIVEQQWL